jgi:signal transduction histidine kinase
MGFFQRLPLARKILLGIVPVFLLFVTLSVALHNHFQEREMMDQAQLSALTYAEIIKESLVSMMVINLEVDESFMERVNALQQFDSLHIIVNELKLRPEILPPDRVHALESKHRTFQPHDEIERTVLAWGRTVFQRVGDRFRAVVPFHATSVCQECHAVPIGYTLGATDIHISLSRVSEAAAGNWRRSVYIFIGFSLVAISIATIMFRRFVGRPVEQLVKATKEISLGNLDYTVRASGGAAHSMNDELHFLAQQFDTMRESLKDKITQLDKANRSLSERNKEIEEALLRLRQAQEDLIRSERLAATGKMTAQLSHEINNPIHNIQSLLETTLRKVNGNEQARELVGIALEEVTRMAKLTRQMLDFYRGSVSAMEYEPVDLKSLLVESVRMNEEPLARQGIDILLNTPPRLPLVAGSRDKLKQVFLNLILNARDAMPAGGTLTITARASNGAAIITLSDTGTGIPPENLNRIFDAFFTTKKEVSGVGLGLSVTYGIIQQHKGSIRVTSVVGKGTTFTIELPTTGDDDGQGN